MEERSLENPYLAPWRKTEALTGKHMDGLPLASEDDEGCEWLRIAITTQFINRHASRVGAAPLLCNAASYFASAGGGLLNFIPSFLPSKIDSSCTSKKKM